MSLPSLLGRAAELKAAHRDLQSQLLFLETEILTNNNQVSRVATEQLIYEYTQRFNIFV